MDRLVECRSDHAYIGYPVAFYWQGMRLQVDDILIEHRTPQGYSYQVRNRERGIFILDYDSDSDLWSVEQK
jgi:hypothetical protein